MQYRSMNPKDKALGMSASILREGLVNNYHLRVSVQIGAIFINLTHYSYNSY